MKKSIPLKEQRKLFEDNLSFLAASFSKYKVNQYVIGIDPSLNHSAIAINEIGNKQIKFEDSPELIRDSKLKLKVITRIACTRNWLIKTVNQYHPRLICIEGYAYGKTQNRELMGEVGGMIRLNVFHDQTIVGPVIIVGPTQLKKYILGSAQVAGGEKTKQLIILNIFKKLKIETSNDNQADAVVLCKIGKDLVKFVKEYRNKRFDSDKKIREFINNGWEGTKFPKYRWEVLCSLIINKSNRTLFDFSEEGSFEFPYYDRH